MKERDFHEKKEQLITLLEGSSKTERMPRYEMMTSLSVSEKTVRDMISALRKDGWWILSSSDTPGFWLSTDPEEYEAFRNDMLSRARDMYDTIEAMDLLF